MLRRLPRIALVSVIYILSVSTMILFLTSERRLKSHLEKKIRDNQVMSLMENPLHLLNARMYPQAVNYKLKDWHDYEFMAYEESRLGPGENGTAVILTDPEEIQTNDKLREVEGLNVFISDKISVNRSLPDVRHFK